MKRILLCLFILDLNFSATSMESYPELKVGQAIPPPIGGFTSEAELDRWATQSSFGGGYIKFLAPGIYAAIRSSTSGRVSSELFVFAKKNGRYNVQLILPSQPHQCELQLQDRTISIYYNIDGKNQEFIKLSIDALLRL